MYKIKIKTLNQILNSSDVTNEEKELFINQVPVRSMEDVFTSSMYDYLGKEYIVNSRYDIDGLTFDERLIVSMEEVCTE